MVLVAGKLMQIYRDAVAITSRLKVLGHSARQTDSHVKLAALASISWINRISTRNITWQLMKDPPVDGRNERAALAALA